MITERYRTSGPRTWRVPSCASDGLSWEQAKVVDPELGLSKAEYDAVELPDPGSEPGVTGHGNMVSEPGVTGLTDEGTLFGQS